MRNLHWMGETRQVVFDLFDIHNNDEDKVTSVCWVPVIEADEVTQLEATTSFLDGRSGEDDKDGDDAHLRVSTTSSSTLGDPIILTERGMLYRMRLISANADQNQPAVVLIWKTNVAAALEEYLMHEYDHDGEERIDPATLSTKQQQGNFIDTTWFLVTPCWNTPTLQQLDTNSSSPMLCCLSHRTGAIATVHARTGKMDQIVGTFTPYGITAAAWNPSREVLAIVTNIELEHNDGVDPDAGGDGTSTLVPQAPKRQSVLLTMNIAFEVLSEIHIDTHNMNEAVHVTWRPDGTLLAISSVDVGSDDHGEASTTNTRRKIRLYRTASPDRVLFHAVARQEDASGRMVPNLVSTAPLAWAGAACSHLLTTVQGSNRKGGSNDTLQVSFLEPNGLRHGQFQLRTFATGAGAGGAVARSDPATTTTSVVGLSWNPTSDLLAVTLKLQHRQQQESPSSPIYKVQLWHRSNYHWYLKQEMNLSRQFGPDWNYLIAVYWQPDDTTIQHQQQQQQPYNGGDPYQLHVVMQQQQRNQTTAPRRQLLFATFSYHWRTADIGSVVPPLHHVPRNDLFHNSVTAFVVDGSNLHMTPFHLAIVPPPMYHATLSLSHALESLHVMTAPHNQHVPVSHQDSTVRASVMAIGILSSGEWIILVDENPTLGCTVNIRTWQPPRVVSFHLDGSARSLTGFRNLAVVSLPPNATNRMCVLAAALQEAPSGILIPVLVVINITGDRPDSAQVTATIQHVFPAMRSDLWTIAPWLDTQPGALVQLSNGELWEYESTLAETANSTTGQLVPSAAEPLPEVCPMIACWKEISSVAAGTLLSPDGEHQTHRSRLVVGQSQRGRLYFHDVLLADAITSFVASHQYRYLCFVTTATSQCQLRFVALTDLIHFDPLQGSDEHFQLQGVRYEPRNVERGTRLVAILPTTVTGSNRGSVVSPPSAILQMPRGNLERTYPRALVLQHVMRCIWQASYGEALAMMRCQKVDVNLIVDMDPWYFIRHGIETFLEQVHCQIDYLNLFISCLQNGDCTVDRYPIPVWLARIHKQDISDNPTANDQPTANGNPSKFDFDNKVNQVCRKLREVMIEAEHEGKTSRGSPIGEGYFLLPILSTFAKENPPKLEDALVLIKTNAFKKVGAQSKQPPLFSERAQSSIQYLAFLADYELLYSCALSFYDYELARAVARNSQMDPKLYLPQLKRYRTLPIYYGRYEVDMRLKRYDLALRNLYQSSRSCESLGGLVLPSSDDESLPSGELSNSFERSMLLVESYNLHRLGLELFADDVGYCRRILLSLGDFLLKQNQPSAALSVLLAAEPLDFDRCMRAARTCRDWPTFFTLAMSKTRIGDSCDGISFEAEKLLLMAREIANDLVSAAEGSINRRPLLCDGARILLDYGKDVAGAVDLLIKAEIWTEAQRICRLHGRVDLARRCLDSAETFATSCISDLVERGETFVATSERYADVLKIRKDAILASGEEPGLEMGDVADIDDSGSLFSAASNASNLSLRSTTTVGSVSTVISVKSAGSFRLSGADSQNRHKSKFNSTGKQKEDRRKKRKNKGKGRTKTIPGSEQELVSLVQTLESACVDDAACQSISSTIRFLFRNSRIEVSRELYECYNATRSTILRAQEVRIQQAKDAALEARRQFGMGPRVQNHPVEDRVDALSFPELANDLYVTFGHVPTL